MNKNLVTHFERLINKINVVYGLVIPVGGLTAVAITMWFVYPSYFQKDSLAIYIAIIIFATIVMGYHLANIETITRPKLRLLYVFYHIDLSLFCLFVAPYDSPFNFLWIILGIGMDLLFGLRWASLTFLIYFLLMGTTALRLGVVYDKDFLFGLILNMIGLICTTLMVSQFRKVSDQERDAITKSFDEKEYERQRLVSLINNMGEAVIAVNKKGKVLIYNSALLILLDTNKNLKHRDIGEVFQLKNQKGHSVDFTKLIKSAPQGFTTTEYLHEFSGDEKMNLFLSIAPIRLGFREHTEVGSIIIARDITKEKSLDEAKDEFINVVGHELRTPTAIAEGAIGNTIMLAKKEGLDEHITAYLEQAHKQVIFLASMVNDISTLSRAERDETKMDLSTIQPTAFLEDFAKDYRNKASEKGLNLVVKRENDVPSITTEQLYLREIMQNFMTNALKYTEKGTITLSAKNTHDGKVAFMVSDTGVGLSKADISHVFEKFYRVENYKTRETSGTGLGLYITHKLAEKLHGKIDLKSEAGKGSVFMLILPKKI